MSVQIYLCVYKYLNKTTIVTNKCPEPKSQIVTNKCLRNVLVINNICIAIDITP